MFGALLHRIGSFCCDLIVVGFRKSVQHTLTHPAPDIRPYETVVSRGLAGGVCQTAIILSCDVLCVLHGHPSFLLSNHT